MYPLVMTHSSPWKDPPFLSSVNNLYKWAIYTMAMLNNQGVTMKMLAITKKETKKETATKQNG